MMRVTNADVRRRHPICAAVPRRGLSSRAPSSKRGSALVLAIGGGCLGSRLLLVCLEHYADLRVTKTGSRKTSI